MSPSDAGVTGFQESRTADHIAGSTQPSVRAWECHTDWQDHPTQKWCSRIKIESDKDEIQLIIELLWDYICIHTLKLLGLECVSSAPTNRYWVSPECMGSRAGVMLGACTAWPLKCRWWGTALNISYVRFIFRLEQERTSLLEWACLQAHWSLEFNDNILILFASGIFLQLCKNHIRNKVSSSINIRFCESITS